MVSTSFSILIFVLEARKFHSSLNNALLLKNVIKYKHAVYQLQLHLFNYVHVQP